MRKGEMVLYISITIVLLLVCGGFIFSKLMDGDSEAKPVTSSEEKPRVMQKRKHPSLSAKNRKKKIYIPEGVNLAAIAKKLEGNISNYEKSDLMDQLYGTKHPKVLDIVFRELDNPDKNIRLEALELLASFGNGEIFNNLSKALEDKSAEVREAAIDLLDTVDIEGGSEEEAGLLSKGIADKSEDVRDAALGILSDKPKFEVEIVAETAIKSPHLEVKEEILDVLAHTPTLNGVEIIMQGLADKDPEFKESVQDEIEDITDKRFSSYEDAKRWWDKNKSKFEEEWAEEEEEE